jgi:GNAT superfamily N-acetyltransferase
MKKTFVDGLHYEIDTDPSRLNSDVIHSYLSEQSYWAKGRTKDTTLQTLKHSLCFGVYVDREMVGFARVITDYAVFAYLADVFILESYQGKGLGKNLMQSIFTHPKLSKIQRWMLGTLDAHGLYEKYGFRTVAEPKRWMEKKSDTGF